MHPEINSPDISKVYACVFRPVSIFHLSSW